MKSSKYMDKRIMELSKSQSFLDDEEEGNDDQSFEFHPFRSLQSHNRPLDSALLRGWSSMDHIDPKTSSGSIKGSASYVALISEIDRKMKEHSDILLHTVECLSARVSQLESRSRLLENSLDDLKESIEFYNGRTGGKLKEMENILTEVQGGIQDLKDKQEIAETQLKLQLTKLQVSKDDAELVKKNSTVQASSSWEVKPSVSQQSHQPLPVQLARPQSSQALYSNVTNVPIQSYPPTMPALAAPQLPIPGAAHPPTMAATASRFPTQLPQNVIPSRPQQESNFPSQVHTPETIHQQFPIPPTQQLHPSFHNRQPHQLPPHLLLNSQLPLQPPVYPPFDVADPQVHHPSSHHLDEVTYVPSHAIQSQRYSPLGASPFLQQFNVGSSQNHGLALNRHYTESTSSSLQDREQANVADFYHYGVSPVRDDRSTTKLTQTMPRSQFQGGESSFSQLPTARTLPHAIPMASNVHGESGSSGSGNTVQVDDIVDKVVAMGFRRDSVRAMVRKLTENGQAVDLNTVLDKLMNDA